MSASSRTIAIDRPAAAALIEWYLLAGADEAVADAPRDRFAGPSNAVPRSAAAPAAAPAPEPPALAVLAGQSSVEAERLAVACTSLPELAAAVAAFDGCALKSTATTTVFADGNPEAPLMLIGEAPGAEEDRRGLPFVGPAGKLLDRMLAAIGRNRDSAYITNVLFWRPPGNRVPTPEEISLCHPFVRRHVELVAPKVLVCLGGIAAKGMLGRKEGITRIRGRWFEFESPGLPAPVPAMGIYHPSYLLRQPAQKREAWRDLLAIEARLSGA